MSELLAPTDPLVASDDRFIVDNMLTDEDLDLDPYFWAEYSSNDSNSDDTSLMTNSPMTDITIDTNVFTPTSAEAPETPPSSDRSTPPLLDDLTHNLLTQTPPTLPPNVTILPPINYCPIGQLSPLSPILPNPTSILTIKTQNHMNLLQNIVNKSPKKSNAKTPTNGPQDLCQMRREARKIRNREAATISRKKKKEYVEGLEHKMDGLLKENADLKKENLKLRSRLNDYETLYKNGVRYAECKCQSLLSTTGTNNRKATLSLLAVIFMLGLNLAPFSGVLISNDNKLSDFDTNPRLGHKPGPSRSLLWNSNDNKNLDMDVIALNASHVRNASNSMLSSDPNCKMFFNQTESLRLETDLRDWLSRVKLEKEEVSKYKELRSKTDRQWKNRFNKPIPLPRLKAWIQKRTETDFNDFTDYAIDSYKPNLKIPKINYEDLLSTIHRRDDTFYLLSYSSKDHLIIPSRNSTEMRPRFSLLIPLMSTLNESLIRGANVTYNQMSVMQIDCQVINTKMVLFNTSPNQRTVAAAPERKTIAKTDRQHSKVTNKTSLIGRNGTTRR